jgi:hypothetical protein
MACLVCSKSQGCAGNALRYNSDGMAANEYLCYTNEGRKKVNAKSFQQD